jgi:hypothetical protein
VQMTSELLASMEGTYLTCPAPGKIFMHIYAMSLGFKPGGRPVVSACLNVETAGNLSFSRFEYTLMYVNSSEQVLVRRSRSARRRI